MMRLTERQMKDHERSRRQMKRHSLWSSSFITSIKTAVSKRVREQVTYHIFNVMQRQIVPEGFDGIPYTQDPLFCELNGVNENEI